MFDISVLSESKLVISGTAIRREEKITKPCQLGAFVLAYRVMAIIIAEQGNNAFLSHGTPHCKVRQDYIDTPTGIRRKMADLFL